jgi:hypothetical protein
MHKVIKIEHLKVQSQHWSRHLSVNQLLPHATAMSLASLSLYLCKTSDLKLGNRISWVKLSCLIFILNTNIFNILCEI